MPCTPAGHWRLSEPIMGLDLYSTAHRDGSPDTVATRTINLSENQHYNPGGPTTLTKVDILKYA